MEKMECPHCGSALTGGVALCGECGREINSQETGAPKQEEEKRGRNNIYVILAVFLVVVGGAAFLMFTGLLPTSLRMGATVAIVNGEKISVAEVNREVETYKKNYGKAYGMDFSTPEGKRG